MVDGFVGAQGEAAVSRVRGAPAAEPRRRPSSPRLIEAGDEASLRKALELDPANDDAIVALAELLVDGGDTDDALALLDRIPETAETRRVAALARTGAVELGDVEAQLDALLDRVRDDDEARQEFLDVLELLGPDDPRTDDLPQGPHQPTVLTHEGPAGATATGCGSADPSRPARPPSRSARW